MGSMKIKAVSIGWIELATARLNSPDVERLNIAGSSKNVGAWEEFIVIRFTQMNNHWVLWSQWLNEIILSAQN